MSLQTAQSVEKALECETRQRDVRLTAIMLFFFVCQFLPWLFIGSVHPKRTYKVINKLVQPRKKKGPEVNLLSAL